MDEQKFDSLFSARLFGTAEAAPAEARLRRCGTLGLAVWGRTIQSIERSERMKIAGYNQHRQARFFQGSVVYATKSTRD
jgi:hypothetical protein